MTDGGGIISFFGCSMEFSLFFSFILTFSLFVGGYVLVALSDISIHPDSWSFIIGYLLFCFQHIHIHSFFCFGSPLEGNSIPHTPSFCFQNSNLYTLPILRAISIKKNNIYILTSTQLQILRLSSCPWPKITDIKKGKYGSWTNGGGKKEGNAQ